MPTPRPPRRPRRDPAGARARRGLSVAEVLVATVLTGVLAAAAVPLFSTEVRSVARTARQQEATQNGRFAAAALERELRLAGVGVESQQPTLVQADARAVTINADLVTADESDQVAPYLRRGADASQVLSLTRADQVRLPLTGRMYPEVTYTKGEPDEAGAAPATAETISFWLLPDPSTPHPDDHVLWRRANAADSAVVARGVVLRAGEAAFRYFVRGAGGVITEVPAAELPLTHSPGAELTVRRLSDVRLMRVRLVTIATSPRTADSTLRVSEFDVRLINTAGRRIRACGARPRPTTLTATPVAVDETRSVELAWDPSPDQSGGEADVERYVVYRRREGAPTWGPGWQSVPAGLTAYNLVDTEVAAGERWQYAVAAQDCSPSLSPLGPSGTVAIP